MHQKLLCTAAAVAIATALSGPAAAADMAMPVKAVPRAPAPVVVSWTGLYVGGDMGWAWANFRGNPSSSGAFNFPDFSTNGLALGLHAGYNWQLGPAPWGSWLVGIEGDTTVTPGMRKLLCDTPSGGAPSCFTSGHTFGQLDALASIRGRLGLVFDRTLIYATGGVAWARKTTEVGSSQVIKHEGIISGGVVGGGIEWKYNPTLSLRLEGLEYIFNETSSGTIDGFRPVTSGLKTATVIRVGFSWNFGPGDLLPFGKGPVVARY